MATAKVSLTLDEELVSEARQIVGERGFSRYVTRALRKQLQYDRINTLLRDLEEAHGPVAPEMREEVRKAWPANEARRGA